MDRKNGSRGLSDSVLSQPKAIQSLLTSITVTLLLAQEADPHMVIEILGRSQIRMTSRYAHVVVRAEISSASCDQAVVVDHAADAGLSSDAVLAEVGRFG
jgi:hypothetical protein